MLQSHDEKDLRGSDQAMGFLVSCDEVPVFRHGWNSSSSVSGFDLSRAFQTAYGVL